MTSKRQTALLPDAPLANPHDVQARATVEAMLSNPDAAGVSLDVLRYFVDEMLQDTANAATGADGNPTGRPRPRALPFRTRVPVAGPYVVSFEELAARASWTCFGPQKSMSSAEALAAIGARAKDAGRVAEQLAQRLPECDQQRSVTMRPIAIPGTVWGDGASGLHWERARAESAIRRQQRQRTTAPSPRSPAAGVAPATASGILPGPLRVWS